MIKGFKDFLMRGNVIDLAVAVVIGVAFNDLVKQFTSSFLQPLINVLSGGQQFAGKWTVRGQVFDWSAFLNSLIAFLLTAATVYFLVILPMNKLHERIRRGEEPPSKTPSEEVQLLTEIRDALVNGHQAGSAVRRVREAAGGDVRE